MRALAPMSLVAACWTLTFGAATLALIMPARFDLMPILMRREALDTAAFAPIGMAWLAIAALALMTGDLAARQILTRPGPFRANINLNRAARIVLVSNMALLLVTALWIMLTASRVGGLSHLVAITVADSLTARDLLLENKLFTGMRLFYAALPATGCLAAVILAAGRETLTRSARRSCLAVLVLNAVALSLLPIVMSQRLLLLHFLLSAYLGACLVRGRLFAVRWLVVGLMVFLSVWMTRESLTNPLLDRSAFDLGLQKLAFYFVNDLWNSFAPLQAETAPTLGAQSLRGLMFLTLTDDMFDRLLAVRLATVESIRGGGEFSLLAAPYVDFGPFGAAVFLVLAGFAFRIAFQWGRQRLIWAAIYAQIGAALLFSSHGIYLTHQNFLFSLAVIVAILRLSRPDIAGRSVMAGYAPAGRVHG